MKAWQRERVVAHNIRRCRYLLFLAATLAFASRPLSAEPFVVGKSERDISAGEPTWRVHAYKPTCYRGTALLMVFHGSDRNPRLARDNAIPLAEAGCALTVAPFFPEKTFPRWAYQFGGIGELLRKDGRTKFRLKPRDHRTGQLVLALIDLLRDIEGRRTMPYFLIGHSAGAQFLNRFAAFFANDASRIVLANPGSYVVPLWERRYPYGLGGLTIVAEADRRRYLGSPIVVLLADRDIGREGLDTSPGAERQGRTRYERGRTVFELAQASAESDGLAFAWSLVEVAGIGHGSARLYGRTETALALFGAAIERGR